jgi:N-acetylneuraminic acid mutarotase
MTDDDFDRQLQAYLEPGPAELADRVLLAARAQLKTTRRRRSGFAWPTPRRNGKMNQHTRLWLVGGTALVAVIGVGVVGSVFTRPNPTPSLSARPSEATNSVAPSASISSVAPAPTSSVVTARAPGWSGAGGMTEARINHTSTLLSDGRVLVAGGRIGPNADRSANSAELYDPGSGTWSATGSMHDARDGQTATLLLNGTVLVAGGSNGRSGNDWLATAELYDPVSGTWTATGDMLTAGTGHTATLLPNGSVLVVGGHGQPTLAELYDPASGTWTATASPKIRYHVEHAATLLPDGRVLVTGGPPNGRNGSRTAEVYDPGSGLWTLTGNMVRVRLGHTATLLPDGRVLVAGGYSEGGSSNSTASAEVYDPSSGSWTAVGKMGTLRIGGWTATLLPNGEVLLVGGLRSGGTGVLASAELYDPGTATWTATASLGLSRAGHTATVLADGRVLVAGGFSITDALQSPMASAELYDPGQGN